MNARDKAIVRDAVARAKLAQKERERLAIIGPNTEKGESVGDLAVTGTGLGHAPEPVPVSPETLVAELVADRPKRIYGFCGYCGRPCRNQACRSHADLYRIERREHRGN